MLFWKGAHRAAPPLSHGAQVRASNCEAEGGPAFGASLKTTLIKILIMHISFHIGGTLRGPRHSVWIMPLNPSAALCVRWVQLFPLTGKEVEVC